jgi:hypothetical protein
MEAGNSWGLLLNATWWKNIKLLEAKILKKKNEEKESRAKNE